METETRAREGALWDYVAAARPAIERALGTHLPVAPAHVGERFNEALRYALFPGGKRLRPVLTLLSAELVGGSAADDGVLRAAVAVEYVHTCSLIFDDLPCMDNSDERRGRAALHRRYGEAQAVLVALALLNASYALVFDEDGARPERALRAHTELVACIGTNGMVTGQTLDLSGATTRGLGVAPRERFDAMRNLKTSALMRLSLRLGAILSGAKAGQLDALAEFAELLGQAYQISDDVLDLIEDAALAVGGTRASTLAYERGAHGARLRVASHVAQAKGVLAREFGLTRPAQLLGQLADYIAERKA